MNRLAELCRRLIFMVKDLRYAVRVLARNPAFTLAILAVSIGASTAVFGAVDAVLIRPLAVTDQSRLVVS